MKKRASRLLPSERLKYCDSWTTRASSTWRRSSQIRRMLSTSKTIKVWTRRPHSPIAAHFSHIYSQHIYSHAVVIFSYLRTQGLSILYLNTWTTTSWVCWSPVWFTSTRATSSLSWDSCLKVWITATRRTFCTETSSAQTFCSITSTFVVFNSYLSKYISIYTSCLFCHISLVMLKYCFFFLLLIRGKIKLADFGLARLYNSEERWASIIPLSFLLPSENTMISGQ